MLHKLITSVKLDHLTDSTRQKSRPDVISYCSRSTRVKEEDIQC